MFGLTNHRCTLVVIIAAALPAGFSGCGERPRDEVTPATPVGDRAFEPHEHLPGMHGGNIVSVGRHEYHAEFVLEAGGAIRVYTLGEDETRVQEVAEQELLAYVRPEGDRQSVLVVLEPQPQPGDPEGMTSQFVGTLPEGFESGGLEITIPNLRIAGSRFRLGFSSLAHGPEMPAGVADEEARELYLTPGGLYTTADIEANGSMTAAEKYRGFRAKHDFNPQPGDAICPITRTKGNPECTWVVGGEVYEFCCPPCIDEFVVMAKKNPEAIEPPEAYVQQ